MAIVFESLHQKHVEVYFEQDLVFSYTKEEVDEYGKNINKEVTRDVLIDYIGVVNSLHKYQICCDKCDIIMNNKIDVTSDLFIAIDFVFTLLVVSSDSEGNLIELHNFPYLQQEWLDLKEKLIDNYEEHDTDNWKLIHAMDTMMKDPDAVLDYIKSPEMYGLFFNGYWKNGAYQSVHKMKYKGELEEIFFDEKINTVIREIGTQQFVELTIKGQAENYSELVNYTGICTYIDGALNMCKKKIDLGSTKYNYSVRWVGLKKRFQDLSDE